MINILRRFRWSNGFVCLMRLGLGCLLLWSSVPKLRHPYGFLSNVYGYELVTARTGVWVASILPGLELLVGLCLVAGLFTGGALLGAFLMMLAFTFAQAAALYRGLSIGCGCFSASDPGVISYATLIRTSLLLICSLVAYLLLLRSANHRPDPHQSA